MRNSFCALLAIAALILCACGDAGEHTEEITTGGDIHRGAAAIERYGCGSCHIIPGISGATGKAGPPLSGIATRTYIAGVLQNTPPNMEKWLLDPPGVDPKTVMPNVGLTPQDARDITGFLYTLQ